MQGGDDKKNQWGGTPNGETVHEGGVAGGIEAGGGDRSDSGGSGSTQTHCTDGRAERRSLQGTLHGNSLLHRGIALRTYTLSLHSWTKLFLTTPFCF